VCIGDQVNLQHAQHDAHNGPHSLDGSVARILPYVLDPQERVCGMRFSWSYLRFASSALSCTLGNQTII